jgi:molybdate transport system substrate-binding protein
MTPLRLHARMAACVIPMLVFVVVGCGSAEPGRGRAGPTPPPAVELRVAAASDLQRVLPDLVEAFARDTATKLSVTFGSSGQLTEQIKQGAPFDIFLAANQALVKDLAASGHVLADTVQPYARGTLVLAVHRESGGSIEGLADLAKPEVKRVALANPAFAPYGVAGKQALERSKLWTPLESKIVQAESVRQAFQFVQSGNAEAGLVGKAIADVPEIRVVEVDAALYDPIIQGLGVVANSHHVDDARRFASFVLSDAGQAILAKYGFARPGDAR